ncbi:uncharacterized protein BT62DRAFT_931637 [Guyanagaster necrorhizus]|uniref:Uncharacterized protein n=1 Tax=Guyanagaster necrorhizus TaxID=856835 RepID=A0A9P8ATJ7_9AGAR|nr:uncharacterized protein BT62DRAFT_931637 [Guyanagaster necrorhizus MCA 3950]KAG7447066.1 hypothetical protein BT62DRAFT_931637 [Guyanagaster necrorhizus MCA 3950]
MKIIIPRYNKPLNTSLRQAPCVVYRLVYMHVSARFDSQLQGLGWYQCFFLQIHILLMFTVHAAHV